MTPKAKAKELVLKYWNLPIKMNHIIDGVIHIETEKHLYENDAKQCALIAVENEYHSLREMLFNLRSCHVIESEKVYLFRLQKLIDEEQEVKQEIEAL